MDAAELPALPEEWEWTTLGELAEYINGKAFKPSDWSEEGRPIIRIQNLTGSNDEIHRFSGEVEDKYIIRNGDLLISWSATLGAYIYKGEEAVLNQHIFKVKPRINQDYLYYLVNNYLNDLKRQTHGSGMVHITKGKFDNTKVPLPSLPVQIQVISRIEELFTQLDAAEAALKRAKTNLVRYRQSVLQAAVTGELTREWREAHAGQIEPASILLERIRAERRAKWEADLRARGKDPSKMKYEEPADPDTSTLPKLPEGWAWGSLEQIGFTGTGATPLRSKEDYYSGGTIPWITSGSLNNPLIIEADEYITELALQETNTKVYPIGTLLVAMYGEGKTRGKVSELAIDAATNQAIAAISILEGHRYLIEYVKIFLQYNYNNIRRLSAGGVQPNLNLSIVKNTQIPLPPRDEQEEIEKKVQEILLTTSKAEDSMNIQLTKITRLRQSVLQRAFCGQLIN